MTEDMREQTDETAEEPEEMTHEAREAHMRGGLRSLLSGLLGIEMPDPREQEIEALREGIAGELDAIPCRMMTLSVIREDGAEVLIRSGFLRSENPEARIDMLADLEGYVEKIVRPALLPDQRFVVREHEFDASFFAEHATTTFDGPKLAAEVQAAKIAHAREEAIERYEKCADCDDADCPIRVTEHPDRPTPND